jgi:hypothetical protein
MRLYLYLYIISLVLALAWCLEDVSLARTVSASPVDLPALGFFSSQGPFSD